jgi:hypothetical protein
MTPMPYEDHERTALNEISIKNEEEHRTHRTHRVGRCRASTPVVGLGAMGPMTNPVLAHMRHTNRVHQRHRA